MDNKNALAKPQKSLERQRFPCFGIGKGEGFKRRGRQHHLIIVQQFKGVIELCKIKPRLSIAINNANHLIHPFIVQLNRCNSHYDFLSQCNFIAFC